MTKILKYILFRSVFIIITLHSLIPHPHENELTDEKHFELHHNANSLFGIIRLFFHESNDESLDDIIFAEFSFLTKTNNKFNIYNYTNAYIYSNGQHFIVDNNKEIIKNNNNYNFKIIPFVKPNGLRGPPSII